MNRRLLGLTVAALAVTLGVTACGSNSKSSASGEAAAAATSAAAAGGMDALVKAAQAEGTLNVITLPRDWANYGKLMDGFTKKYGIKINDANPDGSSQDEITAIKELKSKSNAPDVVDVGQAFAYSGTAAGLFADYKVSTWSDIPAANKDANGAWYNDYGGYISIGYDASKVTVAPTSLASLNNGAYKKMVALNGDPTKANAAFSAVYAAALANGGSLDNIQPGIDFFGKLAKAGIYEPVQASSSTIESGETPIVVNWDYLNVSAQQELKGKVNWKIVVPSDAEFAGYYAQAISAYAPHPAAARLWEEYLYSVTGQNLFLQGSARPVELTAMQTAGTVDRTALAALPAASGTPESADEQQFKSASTAIADNWAAAVG